MAVEKTIAFKVDTETHKKLKMHALQNSITVKALLTGLVINMVKRAERAERAE
jgi:hypothetical protein